jgi:hypothetical protein
MLVELERRVIDLADPPQHALGALEHSSGTHDEPKSANEERLQ